MSRNYEVRSLKATQSTLKWFLVLGIVIMIVSIFFHLYFPAFIGLLFLWVGFMISALSFISLLFLWLSDRILPQPK